MEQNLHMFTLEPVKRKFGLGAEIIMNGFLILICIRGIDLRLSDFAAGSDSNWAFKKLGTSLHVSAWRLLFSPYLQKRGLDFRILRYFPYRDDGKFIFDTIQKAVRDYVNQ